MRRNVMKKAQLTTACMLQAGVVSSTIETEVAVNLRRKEKPMNCLRRLFFRVISVTLVMQLAFGALAFAAPSPRGAKNSQESERDRLRRVMDPATDIEEFRQELYDHFTEMEDALRLFNEIPAVHEKFEKGGLQPLAMLAETKQRITELKPDQLSQMRATYARFPGWRETSRTLASFIKPALRQSLESRLVAKKGSGHIQPNAVTPDNCQDGINADVSNTDISAAQAAVIAADAIMEGFPTDGLTILARLIPIAAKAALEAIALSLVTLKAIKDDCTGLDSTAVQQIVTTSTNTIIANDNTNKTAIVTNDNANKDTILSRITTAK